VTQSVQLSHTECGAGPPLVLIMGLNAPGSAWEPHTEHWQRSFRCFSVDNRGAGSSPAPDGPYSTAEMADDYAVLIDRLRLGPVRVVGISMGGAIAQELALRHPHLVERLVLVATWARTDLYTQTILDLIVAVRKHTDPATFNAHLQSLVWTPRYFAEHPTDLLAARDDALSVGPAALEAQAEACARHDTFHRLSQIKVPTLVTAGDSDRFIPTEASRVVADHVPGARWALFARSGHVHHWEQLVRFNSLVEEFLS
jgi:pimeloyl-ACP methyl ester carboxylesterase